MTREVARCFCAIALPDDARRVLAGVIERVRDCAAGVRWVREEQLHVTLKFFGDFERCALPQLEKALSTARLDAPLQLRVAGLGTFPANGPPRVIWAGVSGDVASVGELARRIEDAAARLGHAREARPFHAHVTLGRVNGARGAVALRRALASVQGAEQCALPPLRAFVLFESSLGPGGSSYRALREFDFAPDRALE